MVARNRRFTCSCTRHHAYNATQNDRETITDVNTKMKDLSLSINKTKNADAGGTPNASSASVKPPGNSIGHRQASGNAISGREVEDVEEDDMEDEAMEEDDTGDDGTEDEDTEDEDMDEEGMDEEDTDEDDPIDGRLEKV
jgi:hypothetical protein